MTRNEAAVIPVVSPDLPQQQESTVKILLVDDKPETWWRSRLCSTGWASN
jgi:hypothetical protein